MDIIMDQYYKKAIDFLVNNCTKRMTEDNDMCYSYEVYDVRQDEEDPITYFLEDEIPTVSMDFYQDEDADISLSFNINYCWGEDTDYSFTNVMLKLDRDLKAPYKILATHFYGYENELVFVYGNIYPQKLSYNNIKDGFSPYSIENLPKGKTEEEVIALTLKATNYMLARLNNDICCNLKFDFNLNDLGFVNYGQVIEEFDYLKV